MATRYDRFVKMQRRFTKRRRRKDRHNGSISPHTQFHNGGGKYYIMTTSGTQDAHGVNSKSFSGNRTPLPGTGGIAPLFTGGKKAGWPHVKFTNAFYIAHRAAGSHQQGPALQYHCRRALRTGHKVGRMRGIEREVMGAAWYAYTWGWFPHWDPLFRAPQLAEFIVNPSDGVGGIWPWGIDPF